MMIIRFPHDIVRNVTLEDIRVWLEELPPDTPVHALLGQHCVIERYMLSEGVVGFSIGMEGDAENPHYVYNTATRTGIRLDSIELNTTLATLDKAWWDSPNPYLTAEEVLALLPTYD